MNCFSDCPRMNVPYLESSKQLHCFFPDFLHKIKSHIFQNIYKCFTKGLIPFKYKSKCGLCDNILDKYKKGRLMVNKCFVIREEVIYVCHEKITPPK